MPKKIVYPEFPLINNYEFMLLFLARHGPMTKRRLVNAVHMWRGPSFDWDFAEFFSRYQGFYGHRYKHRKNFIIGESSPKIVALSVAGMRAAMNCALRVEKMKKKRAPLKKFYVACTSYPDTTWFPDTGTIQVRREGIVKSFVVFATTGIEARHKVRHQYDEEVYQLEVHVGVCNKSYFKKQRENLTSWWYSGVMNGRYTTIA